MSRDTQSHRIDRDLLILQIIAAARKSSTEEFFDEEQSYKIMKLAKRLWHLDLYVRERIDEEEFKFANEVTK